MSEMWAALIGTGVSVEFEGRLWRIDRFDEEGRAKLKRIGFDDVAIDPKLLVAAQSKAHRMEIARRLEYTQQFATWTTLSDSVKEKAEELAEHVREVRTGYKSGNSRDKLQGEPFAEYDPAMTQTIGKRRAAKAAELHVSTRTLERWDRAYRIGGAVALTHQMWLRPRELFPRCDVRWFRAFHAIVRGRQEDEEKEKKRRKTDPRSVRGKTLPTVKVMIEAATANEPDATPPSKSTAYRMYEVLSMGTGHRNISKTRASIEGRPDTRNDARVVSFPGESIQLDTTTLDVFCVDPITGEAYRPELTVAIDQFSRCILAMVIARRTTTHHVAALIAEILDPKPLDPDWPGNPKWPYCGVPFSVQYTAHQDSAFGPVVSIETIIVDNGKPFTSKEAKRIAAVIGYSLEATRPGSGFSKAQVERFFGTSTRDALSRVRGYTGGHVANTLGDPQKQAYFTPDEIIQYLRQWVATQYHLSPQDDLYIPGTETGGRTPFEMYVLGLETFGVLRAPIDQDLALQILPVQYRAITHRPIRMNNRNYNAAVLEKFKYRKSKLPGGKWMVHWNPADLTAVWLQDNEHQFHRIPWTEAVKGDRPFDDLARAEVDHIRARARHLAELKTTADKAIVYFNQFAEGSIYEQHPRGKKGPPGDRSSQQAAAKFIEAAADHAIEEAIDRAQVTDDLPPSIRLIRGFNSGDDE